MGGVSYLHKEIFISIFHFKDFTQLWKTKLLTSPTYENVVTQFLAGNFYCKFGIYNAKSMFCQNIVPLGQLEAEILIDLCSIKRSYSINRFLILSKGRMSLNDQSFVPIRQRYLYESIIQKNTFQSIWHQFSIIVLL